MIKKFVLWKEETVGVKKVSGRIFLSAYGSVKMVCRALCSAAAVFPFGAILEASPWNIMGRRDGEEKEKNDISGARGGSYLGALGQWGPRQGALLGTQCHRLRPIVRRGRGSLCFTNARPHNAPPHTPPGGISMRMSPPPSPFTPSSPSPLRSSRYVPRPSPLCLTLLAWPTEVPSTLHYPWTCSSFTRPSPLPTLFP
jgi:hypothetical protein